jgi:ribonuclease R
MMKDRVGEEFDATISGLSEGGFFVELKDLHIEGMVRTSGWKFDQRMFRGVISGRTVKVGQPTRVKLISVSLERRQLDFELLSLEGGEMKARPPQIRRHDGNQEQHHEKPRQEKSRQEKPRRGKGRPGKNERQARRRRR